MTYNSLIPQPNDLISVSQNDILNNFTSMQNTFSIDHLGFNPISNLGFHQFVTFANVAADPVGLSFQSARAYTKSFGTAPNRNTELYYADKRETSSQLISLIPHIKVMARFTVTGVMAQTILTTNTLSINIASINRSGTTYTATFSAPGLDYDTYYVFFTPPISATSVAAPLITAQTNTSFDFTLGGLIIPIGATIGFMVI